MGNGSYNASLKLKSVNEGKKYQQETRGWFLYVGDKQWHVPTYLIVCHRYKSHQSVEKILSYVLVAK